MRQRISAIIHTLNEEANIANAVESVLPWVDECLVIDMHSEDRTVAIAESLGAKVYQHERCGSADPARTFAEAQATGEWIFILDADEVVPFALAQELRRIADEDVADICTVSRLNYFGGAPLLGSGWGPTQDRIMRFYRKGQVSIATTIHTLPVNREGSRLYTVPYGPGKALVHFNYVNAAHFLDKLNRYTTIEAEQDHGQSREADAYRLVVRPVLEFVNRYVRRGGYKDGWAGFYYCFMMLVYRMSAAMKLHELNTVGGAAQVRAGYQRVAQTVLAENAAHRAGFEANGEVVAGGGER